VFEITPKAVFRHTSQAESLWTMSYQLLFFTRRKHAICFVLPILILLFSIWAYGQASSGSAQQHYKKGVELLEKQQLDAAIEELSLSTRMMPGFADAQRPQCARYCEGQKR